MECCIYETDDDYKAAMAVNVLKKNRILTFAKNRGIQNLFGDSKLYTGSDLIVGEIKIYVKETHAEKAKQVIGNMPLLRKRIKTIENDVIKKNAYMAQRTLFFAAASLFIIPFFFVIDYLVYCFRNHFKVRYILLMAHIVCISISAVFCIKSFEYAKLIWKLNLLFIPAFSLGKYIELRNKKIKYLLFIPVLLLILSYNVAG
ncbi:MAG: DUF2007 domain-containing protein [Treponema sp.]|jgi:hypothetical protein|nr:DUF2007 domain-containing protein [Treponema sp.]